MARRPLIEVVKVVKKYGHTHALKGVSMEIGHGEFFAILGPSGCGKTTLLRIIAGFEEPDEGSVFIEGQDVASLPPGERGAVMVFQNWALWPHMTVYENIAFGLHIRRLSEGEIRERVRRVMELLGLEGLEGRYPGQLSGGQQQRVALARALVVEPKVLLLDEPLSNLDAALRLRLRGELRKLQKELGTTFVYVTHDQEEAMSIADRLAVMRAGRVEQIGRPDELYYEPRSLFVATFLGRTSLLRGRVVEVNGQRAIVDLGGYLVKTRAHGVTEGQRALVVVKADAARETPPRDGDYTTLRGQVVDASRLGGYAEVKLRINSAGQVITLLLPAERAKRGVILEAYLPLSGMHSYPESSEPEATQE